MNICSVPPGIPVFTPASSERLYRWYRGYGEAAPVYSIVPLSEDEQKSLLEEMRDDDDPEELDSVRFAEPRWDFSDVGASSDGLRACWNAHAKMMEGLEDGPTAKFYHNVFFVITTSEWRSQGILAVKLTEKAPTGHMVSARRLDSMTMISSMATSMIANLQIANMDWTEFKNWSDCNLQLSEDEVQESESEDSDDVLTILKQRKSKRLRLQQYWGIWPDIPPLNASFLAVYVIKGIDPDDAIEDLELGGPDHNFYNAPNKKIAEEYDCHVLGIIDNEKNVIEEAIRIHSKMREERPIYPDHFVIVDQVDREHDGVCLVEVARNTTANGANSTEQAQDVLRYVQRTDSCQAHFICQMTAHGLRDFVYDHWSFASISFGEMHPGLLDKSWLCHGYGGEKVVPAPRTRDNRQRITYDWEEAIKQFKLMCRRERLNDKFHKHFFIVSDTDTPAEDGVLLVGIDWDASYFRYNDVETTDEVTADLKTITARRCNVGVAYETLRAIADGEEPFDGHSLKEVSEVAN